MNLIHLWQCLWRSGRTLVPVTRWESVRFKPAVHGTPVKAISVQPICLRTISEAYVSEREASFGRRVASLSRIGRSRAGVRFHATASSRKDFLIT